MRSRCDDLIWLKAKNLSERRSRKWKEMKKRKKMRKTKCEEREKSGWVFHQCDGSDVKFLSDYCLDLKSGKKEK
jgi:hypothetical protein